jgi:hypothetical protein
MSEVRSVWALCGYEGGDITTVGSGLISPGLIGGTRRQMALGT